MTEGAVLKQYIDNQRISKIKIATDLKMSKQNLYGLFQSKELSLETKKKFEDYFGQEIFTGKYEIAQKQESLTADEVVPYWKKRQLEALEEKEYWFPVYQGNTRLRENANEVYVDDPEMQIPIAFLPQNMYPGCDYGERATGNSMYPRVVNQGFALGKILDKNYIKFGELYGIHFKQPEGGPPTIKYVRQCKEDPTAVILKADNPHVDDQIIKLEEITFVFRVLYIVNPA